MAEHHDSFRIIPGQGPGKSDLFLVMLCIITGKDLSGEGNRCEFKVFDPNNEGGEIKIKFEATSIAKGLIGGYIVSAFSEILRTELPIQYQPARISYDAKRRSGTIQVIQTLPERANKLPGEKAIDIITMHSDLAFCNPARTGYGGAEKSRIIVMMEDGSLKEIFYGKEFSQADYEKKLNNQIDITGETLRKKATARGCGELALQIWPLPQ